jgi:hypothetical protein
MKSALGVSTFLDTSRSLTAEHPHGALGLRGTETTTSASQLEAHLKASPVELFPDNCDIFEQSACQVADRDPQQFCRRLKPKR